MGRDLTPSLATLGKERGTRPKGCGEGRMGNRGHRPEVRDGRAGRGEATEETVAAEVADRREEQVESALSLYAPAISSESH